MLEVSAWRFRLALDRPLVAGVVNVTPIPFPMAALS